MIPRPLVILEAEVRLAKHMHPIKALSPQTNDTYTDT
jgi:hypothetical protein